MLRQGDKGFLQRYTLKLSPTTVILVLPVSDVQFYSTVQWTNERLCDQYSESHMDKNLSFG